MKVFLTHSRKLSWLYSTVLPFQQASEIKVLHENDDILSGDVLNLFKEYGTHFLILILWTVINSCFRWLLVGSWHTMSQLQAQLYSPRLCVFVCITWEVFLCSVFLLLMSLGFAAFVFQPQTPLSHSAGACNFLVLP